MVTSTKAKLKRKKTNRQLIWVVAIIGFLALVFLAGFWTIFFSGIFKLKSFSIDSNDAAFKKDEVEKLQEFLLDSFKGRNILFIRQGEVENFIKDNFDDVKNVEMDKGWSDNVKLTVNTYIPAFVGCEKDRQFLISCMYGDADGVLYKEAGGDYKDAETLGIYFFEIEKDALNFVDQSKNTLEERLNIDSLEGTRIYSPEEMKQIFALLKYFERVEFHLKKVEIKALKILEITTDKYVFVVSLQKGFDETVKGYEIFSTNEETKDILKKPDLEVVDLSYKDKVFYKLYVQATTSATSTNLIIPIATTTATTSLTATASQI